MLITDVVGLGALGASSTTVARGSSPTTGLQLGSGPGSTNGATGSTAGAAGSSTTGGGAGPGGTIGAPGSSSTAGGPASSASGPLLNLGHGVGSTSIRVVFPWPNVGAVASVIGIYGSSEDPTLSITAAVNAINAAGGINGRTISPEIVQFNPLDDAAMRADCIKWTQDQQVFAVVDSNAWHDDHQLCITQENHTPLISSWTTVPDWTNRGNPNLWWTGPDAAEVLDNLVAWAVGQHQLGPAVKFGVVSADREGDNLAVGYLGRSLAREGLKASDSGSMHFALADAATAQLQARNLVTRFRAAGITTVIPLLPYTDFLYFVEAAKEQNWVPHWLLSDYEQQPLTALGLIDPSSGGPYAQELDNTVNPTFLDLGNCDCSQPLPIGYNSFGQQCQDNFAKYSGPAWAKEDKQQTGNDWSGYIETTGTAMTWCQNIDLFAAAARAVPPNQLTQANFDQAMMKLSHFTDQLAPDLSYSASRRAGPHEFRVVQEHVNGDGKCPKKVTGHSQGDCWLIQQDFQPELHT
jgi:hypothetical protein